MPNSHMVASDVAHGNVWQCSQHVPILGSALILPAHPRLGHQQQEKKILHDAMRSTEMTKLPVYCTVLNKGLPPIPTGAVPPPNTHSRPHDRTHMPPGFRVYGTGTSDCTRQAPMRVVGTI
jgi:hypothetical protein